jgi:hypothetical protein
MQDLDTLRNRHQRSRSFPMTCSTFFSEQFYTVFTKYLSVSLPRAVACLEMPIEILSLNVENGRSFDVRCSWILQCLLGSIRKCSQHQKLFGSFSLIPWAFQKARMKNCTRAQRAFGFERIYQPTGAGCRQLNHRRAQLGEYALRQLNAPSKKPSS